jgi:hypothetical protein
MSSAALKEAGEKGIDRPIALLRLEPENLALRAGINFEEVSDDLDQAKLCLIRTTEGRPYILLKYLRSPQAGTEVLTTSDSADLASDLDEVLEELGLTTRDVAWELPELKLQRLQANEPRLRSWVFAESIALVACAIVVLLRYAPFASPIHPFLDWVLPIAVGAFGGLLGGFGLADRLLRVPSKLHRGQRRKEAPEKRAA